MQLKEGMQKINWIRISPKVQAHGLCSISNCHQKGEYMKKYKNCYRIFCKKHATK